jgi:hypothetical protein
MSIYALHKGDGDDDDDDDENNNNNNNNNYYYYYYLLELGCYPVAVETLLKLSSKKLCAVA